MPTVSDVLRALDRRVPESSAASWDPSGLQIGDRSGQVETVAVSHEVTEEVVAAVESDPPDLLVTYHPLLFRPTNRLIAGRSPTGRALRLIRSGVSLAVMHTSFDSVAGGTGDALAAALELVDVRPFGHTGPAPALKVVTFVPPEAVDAVAAAMAAAGAGRIGNYTGCSFRSQGTGAFVAGEGSAPSRGGAGENREAETRLEMLVDVASVDAVTAALVWTHPYEEPAYDIFESTSNARFIGRIGRHRGSLPELAALAADVLGGDGLRVSGADDAGADLVAVLPGSGASFIESAVAAGAEVLITGDVDHHRVVAATDRRLSIIDPGHAPTERPGMAALVRLVREAVAEVEVVDLTGHDPTPWR